ncbi:6-phosphofructokinase [Microbacterium sp. SSM24]|uniref:6-phosphofructokinase n=1 Tax=Microbacterium sp. SSM24 TaxID=2991714 RepID=UPI0022268559|nr:ATP-dependent 6-phosphofructokinase [Microbacterium sp. SSM24]MCW3492720.1 ATP-dependent 6-phosphofructokinase [Microbacterium sp. SSM24]
MPRFGILTSGGDCPGLNAVIRSAYIRVTREYGGSLVGFRNGWRGVLDNDVVEVTEDMTRGVAGQGGTILGTSRTNPTEGEDALERVWHAIEANDLDGVIAIGGEGSLSAAHALSCAGIKVVGVPKTIDNDLNGTDYSFGFDTAVQIATDAMDRLLTTGASHGRCMIAEVMGRNSGWIALHSGIATGAHAVLIPEHPVSLDQVVEWVESARDRNQPPLVVVAEGFPLDDGEVYNPRGAEASGRPRLGGIGERLAPLVEARTGIETRATTLGHIQRGGTPTAYDRVLAARFGAAAVDAAASAQWGQMVALAGEQIVRADLVDAIGSVKRITAERYGRAAVCFG